MSSRVFTHFFKVSLASRIFYSSQRLHMEVNTSHNYHNINMEVWQRPREIFLGQSKYAVNILKRFQMEDCKPMATPMITKLKKVTISYSELVDSYVE
jgi:hypothetical protein